MDIYVYKYFFHVKSRNMNRRKRSQIIRIKNLHFLFYKFELINKKVAGHWEDPSFPLSGLAVITVYSRWLN